MGRNPQHDATSLLAGARALLDAGRTPAELTIKAVSAEVSAPVGSIYYRFPSRAALLASLWLDAVEGFQADLAARAETSASVGELARWPIEWCREHPSEARVLLVFRRDELLLPDVPEDLAARAAARGRELLALHRRLARRFLGSTRREALAAVRLALAEVPLAAIRERLRRGEALPTYLDDWVDAAAEAVVARAKGAPP
ncbi:MAG: TetR family transcriptional regulator [Myxococcales bacterium]|nr:TetR family transcriptional regulator [Myxococcales bacterium]